MTASNNTIVNLRMVHAQMKLAIENSEDKIDTALSLLSLATIELSSVVGHEKASLFLKAASTTEARL